MQILSFFRETRTSQARTINFIVMHVINLYLYFYLILFPLHTLPSLSRSVAFLLSCSLSLSLSILYIYIFGLFFCISRDMFHICLIRYILHIYIQGARKLNRQTLMCFSRELVLSKQEYFFL